MNWIPPIRILPLLIASSDNSLSTTQDIYYGGELSAWQKLVNTFKLRVLISLSNKASDATMNIPGQFANIVNNPTKYPIFTSPSDDLVTFNYNPGGANIYSTSFFTPTNFGSVAARYNMAATYVSALASISDPRVFITCEPAPALLGNNPNPCQYQYFVGTSTGEATATMYPNNAAGKYSLINRHRYYSNFTGEANFRCSSWV